MQTLIQTTLVALLTLCLGCGSAPKKDEAPVGAPPVMGDQRVSEDGIDTRERPPTRTQSEGRTREDRADPSAPKGRPSPHSWREQARADSQSGLREDLTFNGERHLTQVMQLSRGGQNAEAYFSPNGQRLSFQATRTNDACDRIFTMNVDGSDVHRVSNGIGVTTCAHYMPNNRDVLFASTHASHLKCPDKPDPRDFGGYVWPVYPEFDIFVANPVDGGALVQLTDTVGYDAEATVSPRGDRIVFTSARDQDLDLYSMNTDGSDVKRLTSKPGYDGGAFYSWDGKKIVYRAHHPKSADEIKKFQQLLERGVVQPSKMEIFVMDADGRNKKQLTSLGAASFAPFFHPSNERIIFVSNFQDPTGHNFEIYIMRVDGTGIERITFNPSFDGFPMFDASGTKLVFASNRSNGTVGETNIFVANWKE